MQKTIIDHYLPQLPNDCLIYLDPPYYNKAKALYLNAYNKNDHGRLAETIQSKIQHRWVLSYDGVSQIIDLYSQRSHFLYNLQYSAVKSYKGQEVFILCDHLMLAEKSYLNKVNEGLQAIIHRDIL